MIVAWRRISSSMWRHLRSVVNHSSSRIGDAGVFPNPDALVDTPTQVLGKVSVDVLVDPLRALISIDDDASHRGIPSSLVDARARARSWLMLHPAVMDAPAAVLGAASQ